MVTPLAGMSIGQLLGTLGGPVTSLAMAAAPAVISAIPGPMEREFRRQIQDDLTRLSLANGGLTEGQRQSLQGQGMSQINAQQQAMLAQMQRGVPMSGAQQQGVQDVYRQSLQAGQALQSRIRALDVAELQRQQADLQNRMLMATQMGTARKNQALGFAQANQQDFYGFGSKIRDKLGTDMEQVLDGYLGNVQ